MWLSSLQLWAACLPRGPQAAGRGLRARGLRLLLGVVRRRRGKLRVRGPGMWLLKAGEPVELGLGLQDAVLGVVHHPGLGVPRIATSQGHRRFRKLAVNLRRAWAHTSARVSTCL